MSASRFSEPPVFAGILQSVPPEDYGSTAAGCEDATEDLPPSRICRGLTNLREALGGDSLEIVQPLFINQEIDQEMSSGTSSLLVRWLD